MKNGKNMFFAIALFMGIVSFYELQANNFELINNSSNGIEISAILYDSSTRKETDLGPIVWNGEKYTGTIPLNRTTFLTIFSGHNPKGFQYFLDIDPKKVKTIFLEWNHHGNPKLQPQKIERKHFFSKNTNIKAADLKRTN